MGKPQARLPLFPAEVVPQDAFRPTTNCDHLQTSTQLYCQFSVPSLPTVKWKERFIAHALQLVKSDRGDNVGRGLTQLVAGNHNRCWYLLHDVQNLLTASVSSPDVVSDAVIIRVGIGHQCDPPGLRQVFACLVRA